MPMAPIPFPFCGESPSLMRPTDRVARCFRQAAKIPRFSLDYFGAPVDFFFRELV